MTGRRVTPLDASTPHSDYEGDGEDDDNDNDDDKVYADGSEYYNGYDSDDLDFEDTAGGNDGALRPVPKSKITCSHSRKYCTAHLVRTIARQLTLNKN